MKTLEKEIQTEWKCEHRVYPVIMNFTDDVLPKVLDTPEYVSVSKRINIFAGYLGP